MVNPLCIFSERIEKNGRISYDFRDSMGRLILREEVDNLLHRTQSREIAMGLLQATQDELYQRLWGQ